MYENYNTVALILDIMATNKTGISSQIKNKVRDYIIILYKNICVVAITGACVSKTNRNLSIGVAEHKNNSLRTKSRLLSSIIDQSAFFYILISATSDLEPCILES